MTKTEDKKIVGNPRTIYSLAMTAVLFGIYNSEILKSQNSLIVSLKAIIVLLILGHLSYLLMRGLALADVKAKEKAKILKTSDWVFSYFIQGSVVTFIVSLFLADTDFIFNQFGVPKILPFKLLYFLILLISVVIGMYIWKKLFDITETKKTIYICMILWMLIGFYLIVFRL